MLGNRENRPKMVANTGVAFYNQLILNYLKVIVETGRIFFLGGISWIHNE